MMDKIGKILIGVMLGLAPCITSAADDRFAERLDSAYALNDENHFAQAITMFEALLDELPADSTEAVADICSTLLYDHLRLGHLDKALAYGERCLKIDQENGDRAGMASSLSNLASVCLSANRLDEAEQYLQRAINIEREDKREEQLAIRLGMLCEVYTAMKKPDKALPLAQEALELDQGGGREKKAAIRMSQLGNCLVCLHRSAEAMPYLTKALELHEKHSNRPSQIITLSTLGMAARDLGRLEDAKDYLRLCIDLAEEQGQMQSLMRAHEELAQIYSQTKDPRAYEEILTYVALKDSLQKIEVQRQISDFEVQYDTYQKEQQLIQKELLIQRQRSGYIAMGIALLLVLSVTFFLVNLVRLKNQNMRLKDEFMQIISHDLKNPALAQQSLLHKLPRLIDNGDTETLRQMITQLAQESDAHVSLLYSLLDWAGLQTGRLQYSPTTLDLQSIVLQVMAQHKVQAHAKQVTLTHTADSTDHTIHADAQMVGAMIRNILSNAIKFSYTKGEVLIEVTGTTVSITDHGVGFGNESKEKGTGLGLKLVAKMAKINHTDLLIDKNTTDGTRISLTFQTENGKTPKK